MPTVLTTRVSREKRTARKSSALPQLEERIDTGPRLCQRPTSAARHRPLPDALVQLTPAAAIQQRIGAGRRVFALSATGKLEYANPRGMSLIRRGIGVAQHAGYLIAAKASEQVALESALRRAACGRPSHLALRFHTLTKESDWLCLTLLKLSEQGRHTLHQGNATVLCLATHVASQRTATGQQFMTLFGLTPAEARLARALAQNETLADYAAENQLSLATVKSQLRHVLAKTGTVRQAQLIRLLTAIPAVREPYSAQDTMETRTTAVQRSSATVCSGASRLHDVASYENPG